MSQPPQQRRRRSNGRSGYALVLLVMMMFVFLGLAALVIDMGFVRLTQRQMRTAVDTAVLEGLRWRDVQHWDDLPPAWLANPDFQNQVGIPGTGPLSVQQRETIRRWAASNVVANLFANDPNPDPANYGAGPVVGFQGQVGPTSLAAGQTIVIPNPPIYKPTRSDGTTGLELNASGNAVEGDLVAGTYGGNPSYQPDADDPDGTHDENASYGRRDFHPATASNAPTAPAFLVRMRRTTNPNGIDSEPGISSGGVVRSATDPNSTASATLPYLFGRGSLMSRTSAAQGVTVRATAIAAAEDKITFGSTIYNAGRAKAAGAPYQYTDPNNSANNVTIPGMTPFALMSNFWNGAAQTTIQVNSDGTLVPLGSTDETNLLGQVMVPTLAGIGQTVVAAGNATPLTGVADPTLHQYVPIFQNDGVIGTGNIIIGFGYVTWSRGSSNGTTTLTLTTGSLGAQPVGSGNVTGVIALPIPQSLNVVALFQSHASLVNPVYAPVLVDHYIAPN